MNVINLNKKLKNLKVKNIMIKHLQKLRNQEIKIKQNSKKSKKR